MTRARALLPFAAWACFTGSRPAHAHAPLARALALSPDGSALALRMPGFGLLVRASTDAPFAYACDALLGVDPAQVSLPWAFRADGALLLATAAGLRALGAEGCPIDVTAVGLPAAPIVALVASPDHPDVLYAVIAGDEPALHRSDDGGERWTRRAALPGAADVSALLVHPDDPARVYLSQVVDTDESLILVSDDGGETLTAFGQSGVLRLLHVERGARPRLWATAPDAGIRGALILRADQPDGPWDQRLRVSFFGGFAVDAASAIWVGDEGGGVYRSTDGGDRFEEPLPDTAVACLSSHDEALWACTPGTSTMRALAVWNGARQRFDDVVAFADVDRLVECAPELDVADVCAAAWTEWRIDVQPAAATPAIDAPLPDAGEPDVDEPDAALDAAHHPPRSASCSLSPPQRPAIWSPALAGAAILTTCRRLLWRLATRSSKAEK